MLETWKSKNIPNFDYTLMKNDPIIVKFDEYVKKKLGFGSNNLNWHIYFY